MERIDNEPYFSDLDFSNNIFIMVSGGRDSTALVLSLWDYCNSHNIDKKKVTLVFGDTRISKPSSRKVIEEMVKLTGFDLSVARYEGEESPISVLNKSFMKIPDAVERRNKPKEEGKTRSYKNMFACCNVLKKQPMTKYMNDMPRDSTIVIIGIKGGDAAIHRRYRLKQLRDLGTYYRRHKSGKQKGLLYYYPLRDCDDEDIDRVLERYGMNNIKGSGCNICPIFLVARGWDKKDEDMYRRSLMKAKTLGIKLEKKHLNNYHTVCKTIQTYFE